MKKVSAVENQGKTAYLFLAVPILLLIVFLVIPIFIALFLSFTDYDVVNKPSWVGVANYKRLFGDQFFWIAFKNTLYYTLLYVPLGLVTALASALFLNSNRRLVGMFRTFFYIPVLSSTVATATLWFWILNPQYGLLNQVLGLFGINGPAWLYDSKLAMISIIIMSVWAGFGSNMMIFLSGLQSISKGLYEAASIEGANVWQRFVYITLPSLSRTTFLVSTMLIIGAFQVFDQAFVLTKGGPGNATITLVYYIYNNGFKNLKMGYASSISFVVFAMIFVMSFINMKISQNDSDGGTL